MTIEIQRRFACIGAMNFGQKSTEFHYGQEQFSEKRTKLDRAICNHPEFGRAKKHHFICFCLPKNL